MASILVVEERAGSHEVLRSALVIAGHDVVVSGPAVPKGRYDLALVDCRGESAPSVVGEARRRASRVVLYSDAPEEELKARAEQAGPPVTSRE
jgi:hypothetical protein